jgi:hypothetical protein
MPHTSQISKGLSSGDEALSRARLHVTGGRARLERGEIADAIAASSVPCNSETFSGNY